MNHDKPKSMDILDKYLGLPNKVKAEFNSRKGKGNNMCGRCYNVDFFATSYQEYPIDDWSEIGKKIVNLKENWQCFKILTGIKSYQDDDQFIYRIIHSFILYMSDKIRTSKKMFDKKIRSKSGSTKIIFKPNFFDYIKTTFLSELYIYNNFETIIPFEEWKKNPLNFFAVLKGLSGSYYILVEPHWFEFYKLLSISLMEGTNECFIYPIISRQYKHSYLPSTHQSCKNFIGTLQNNNNTNIIIVVQSDNSDNPLGNNKAYMFLLLGRLRKWYSIQWFIKKLELMIFNSKTPNCNYYINQLKNKEHKRKKFLDPFLQSGNFEWDHYNFLFSYLYNFNNVNEIFNIVISFNKLPEQYDEIFIIHNNEFLKEEKVISTSLTTPGLKRKVEEIYSSTEQQSPPNKKKRENNDERVKMGNNVIGFFFSAIYIDRNHCMDRGVFTFLYEKFFTQNNNSILSNLIELYPNVARTLYLVDMCDTMREDYNKDNEKYIPLSMPQRTHLIKIIDTQVQIRMNSKHEKKQISDDLLKIAIIVVDDIFSDSVEETNKLRTKEDIIDDNLLLITEEVMILSIYEMCRDHLKGNFNNMVFSKEEIYKILFSLKLLFKNDGFNEIDSDMESTMEDTSKEESSSNYEQKLKHKVSKTSKTISQRLKKYEILGDWCVYESKIVEFYSNKITKELLSERMGNYINFYKSIPIKTSDLEQYLNSINKNCETSTKSYNSNFHIWAAALEIFAGLIDFDTDSKESKELISYIFEVSKDPISYKTFNSYVINPKNFITKKPNDNWNKEEHPQSFIINTTDILQTKSKSFQKKGQYNRMYDYIINGNSAIWDTDSIMLTNPKISQLNITYDEYELALYNKLKKKSKYTNNNL